MQADWTEEKEKEAGENWKKLVEKALGVKRGTGQGPIKLTDEEEKEQYYRNCYNYMLLT